MSAPPPSPSFVTNVFVNLRFWRPFFDSLVAFGVVHTQSGLIPGGVEGCCCRSSCDGGEQGLHCVPLYLSRVLNAYFQDVFAIFLSCRVLFVNWSITVLPQVLQLLDPLGSYRSMKNVVSAQIIDPL
jgi:hypothetical protein